MTVKELRERLAKYPDDLEVVYVNDKRQMLGIYETYKVMTYNKETGNQLCVFLSE